MKTLEYGLPGCIKFTRNGAGTYPGIKTFCNYIST